MRRRRQLNADTSGLDEPLLSTSDRERGTSHHGHGDAHGTRRKSSGGSALVPYSINAYDWADLLRSLAAGAASGLRSLKAALQGCVSWWRVSAVPVLSVGQLAELQRLRERISVPYDPDSPQHQGALRALWAAAFPGEPCTVLKTERWKDMGWQGTDPATDFRGAGFLSLECHLYMAEHHPVLFDALRHKRRGSRSAWEYPFAAAGVNLTFTLLELLDLRHAARSPNSAAGRAFLRLLPDGSSTSGSSTEGSTPGDRDQARQHSAAASPFEELYCAAYAALDRHWLAARATYMEFPAVMKSTTKDVESALISGRGSLTSVVRQLRPA